MALGPVPEERLGFLRDCLVEGNADQERRVRRSKQRALFLSIVVQVLIVATLVLFPLLSRGERIDTAEHFTILPPAARLGSRSHHTTEQHRPTTRPPSGRVFTPNGISPVIAMHVPANAQQPTDDTSDDSETSRYGSPNGVPWGIPDSSSDRGPAPLVEKKYTPEPAKRIHIGSIQPAMLYRRIEPIYPPLARQLRHEGRVELHAVISTDGSIQSLEVISGDPLLIQSAIAAVHEWRYHPTILNGQPVEVDTHITVVYTLSH